MIVVFRLLQCMVTEFLFLVAQKLPDNINIAPQSFHIKASQLYSAVVVK